ncbi:MAG: tetratricopeptide repeat protein [Bacteroidota bacterium]|nr:tetratricopeptide repeat protein [Bacteroidota bacterium]MDP4233661.1 tetratricopeptide repeat protein [Bacteroidota bacterium]MDP4243079.1 tetratricopeptide repeat protein [Bacteroidota bacterium]MDP4288475.1 tetratricopeptide repeat protein [Bacteroidota bacterium]
MKHDLEAAKQAIAKASSPEERLRVLLESSRDFYRSSPKDAAKWAQEALTLAKKRKDRDKEASAHYRLGCAQFQLCEYAVAEKSFHKAIELDSPHHLVEGPMFSLGLALSNQGKYKEAIDYYEQALKLSREQHRQSEVDILGALGNAALEQGDYPKALEYQYASLSILERSDDPLRRSIVLGNIARVYLEVQALDRADHFFERSYLLAKEQEDDSGMASILYNRGLIAQQQQNDRETRRFFKAALHVATGVGRKESEAYIENSLGELDMAAGHGKAAQQHFERAAELSRLLGLKRMLSASLMGYGRTLVEAGKPVEGIKALKESIQVSSQSGMVALECECSSALAKAYESAGKLKLSIEYFNRYIKLNEEINSQQRQRALIEISARVEIEKADRERERMERLAMDANARAELLRSESERQSNELTTLALQLVEKNEFLCDLKLEIEPAMKSSRRAKSILEKIDDHIRTDRDWETFEHQFNQIHRDFLGRLSAAYPSLTPTELKIAALIKLDLPTKAIANLFCLSVRTVENHRQSIRHKLRLEGVNNLVSFLTSLGG